MPGLILNKYESINFLPVITLLSRSCLAKTRTNLDFSVKFGSCSNEWIIRKECRQWVVDRYVELLTYISNFNEYKGFSYEVQNIRSKIFFIYCD